MIKLKDLLTEQNNYTKTIFDWLNKFKPDFMKKSAKMGFLPSSNYAINQLEGPSGNKNGIISVINYVVGINGFFNNITGDAQPKLKNNKKQLESSISRNTIVLNKSNNVYFDFTPAGRGPTIAVDRQQYMNQSTKWGNSYFGNSVTTMVGSINQINQVHFRTKRPQVIFIAPADKPVNGVPYNKITMGTSDKLHLYSTRDVATKTVPGKEGKPGKVIEIPDIPAINFGGLFRSGQSTLTNPAQGRTEINQAIQTAAAANIGIAQMGTFLVSAGTDQQGSTANNTQLAQNRANSIMALLRAAGVPENQIQIDISGVEGGPVPPPAGSSAQQIAQWRQSTQNFRFVRLSFPGLDTDNKVIPPTKPTPPTKVDAPKKVTINHIEVFIKK